jgi:uncharacterized protein YukE
MADTPLSQATQTVQQKIDQASQLLDEATVTTNNMYESQVALIHTWQGNAQARYMKNADQLHEDLTEAIKSLTTVMQTGTDNVRAAASADNG